MDIQMKSKYFPRLPHVLVIMHYGN